MAKIGRPKVSKPKSEMLTLRVLPEQRVAIDEYASTHGLTRTQVFMEGFNNLVKSESMKK